MSDYSDDEFDIESPPPSPEVQNKVMDVPIISPDAPIGDLLALAKASMRGLQSELVQFDTSNLDDASLPSLSTSKNQGSEKGNKNSRLISPDPPMKPLRRDTWISATRGCGAETQQPKDSSQTTRSPPLAPGLSTEITKIRKKNAPAVSFAPPKHVERGVPKKVPPRKPVTKKSRREALARSKFHCLRPSDVDPVLQGRISRWGGDAVVEKAKIESNDVDLNGVSFAPPSAVDRVEVRERREKEPVTKRGKRIKEEREKGINREDENNGLFEFVPIDTAEFTRRPQGGKFGGAKRECLPVRFKDKVSIE